MTGKTKTPQVQIRLLDSDGEWYQPHQAPTALAAVRAIDEDIRDYPGTYTDANLRALRTALQELDVVISARIGRRVEHEHECQGQKLRHSHDGGDREHDYYEHPEDIPA